MLSLPVLIITAALASFQTATFCDLSSNYLEQITEQRLVGELDDARDAALDILECAIEPVERVDLLIELAKIENRIGLHQNTRPVPAAREALDQAEAYAVRLGGAPQAAVTLAKSEYFYRAEMRERQFIEAERLANDALSMFEALDDKHGQADAVHRLGLIHFQRRAQDMETELARAQELFDRSLALDKAGGARVMFCGEYHRHIGFIPYVREDYETSIPHFEKSLRCRMEAGADDAAMFAAQTLGGALVRADRADEALAPLSYGVLLAQKLNSPVGLARISYSMGEMYEALEDVDAAMAGYELARQSAASVGYESYETAACEKLAEMDAATECASK